tara:strand:- start:1298 stop:1792 length:495 start_codon:yes stop_codon:yes gene_type:complete
MKMLKLFVVAVLLLSSSFVFAAKDDVWVLDADTDHPYFEDISWVGDAITVPVMNEKGVFSFDMTEYGIMTHRAREYKFGEDIYIKEHTVVRSLGVVSYEGVDLEYVVVIDTGNESRKAAPLGTKFFITPDMMGAFRKKDSKKSVIRDGLKSLTPNKVLELESSL